MNRRAHKLMLTALAATAMLCSAAIADTVQVKGLPLYEDCRVTGVGDDLSLQFIFNAKPLEKPLSSIVRIQIAKKASFSQAEEAFARGKAREAVRAYDIAGSDPLLDRLVPVRRLRALEASGAIDRAVQDWLSVMEMTKASPAALAAKPTTPGPKGSKANTAAIALLEDKLTRVDAKGAYATAIRGVLMELYLAQDQMDKADALAEQLGKSPGRSRTAVKVPDRAGAASEDLSAQLDAVAVQIKRGQAAAALDSLKTYLRRYTPTDLPEAMLLMGKAQMALKDKARGQQRRELLLEAGLNFMRVVTFYGSTEEAPEAMYLAGVANLELGNTAAATVAFDRVVTAYGDTDFAPKARRQLERLKKPANESNSAGRE